MRLLLRLTLLLSTVLTTVAATSQRQRELQLPVGITNCDVEFKSNSSTTLNTNTNFYYSVANPMPFCANFGECKPDYRDVPTAPCICIQGYGGPHCELFADEVPDCKLDCGDHGSCMVGATSWEQLFAEELYETDRQYCFCHDGHYGEKCEHAPVECGDEGLLCLNGGTCVEIEVADAREGRQKDNDSSTTKLSYHCDCTLAGDDTKAYAGEMCEYQATTFCSQGLDHNGRHYCVNGGTCKEES